MNATHGLNIAIRSLVVPGSRVVISGYEHNAVCRPLYAIPEVRLTVVDAPPFRREQAAEEFRRAILAGADAVIVNHVSNVFGFILPVEGIALVAGIDRILDMGRTTVNITGDATCAMWISRQEQRKAAKLAAKAK